MTTFVTTNIPSNVNTLERLAAWVGLALNRVNPTLSILESANQNPERVAQAFFYRAADNSLRLTLRITLEVDATYSTQTRKFWENALEISNTALPTQFTSN